MTSSPFSSVCFLSSVVQSCRFWVLRQLTEDCSEWVVYLTFEVSVTMAFKNLADMSSQNVYDFSHEQKAVVCLCVVYPVLFGQNQVNAAFEMCTVYFTDLRWPIFLWAKYATWTQDKSVYIGKDFSSHTNMSFVSLYRKWKWLIAVCPELRRRKSCS